MGKSMKKSRGFTLLEMLISVSILSFLAVIAAPSFSGYMANQALKTTSQSLYMTLVQARSEATKRNADVYVHPADGRSWDNGWYISSSSAGDAIDCSNGSPVATVIRAVCEQADQQVSFKTAPTQIRFTSGGRSEMAQFVLCHEDSAHGGRSVSLDLSGMAALETGSNCS